MSKKLIILLSLLSIVLLAACQETGDTTEDPEAVQNFFPTLNEFTVQETDNLQDAMTTALAGAGLGSGNLVATGVVLKVDDLITCFRETGSFDARLYIEDPSSQLIQDGIRPPMGGILVIINQDRIMDNLLPCLTRTPADGLFSAQSATPEPCVGNGEFVFNDDTIGYIYAATDQPLCQMFEAHFNLFEAPAS